MRTKAMERLGAGMSVSAVALELGWSRKTVYKWIERSGEGDGGVADRSRARCEVERLEGEAAEWLLSVRQRWGWGPTKLLHYAKKHRPAVAWPARSTVAA